MLNCDGMKSIIYKKAKKMIIQACVTYRFGNNLLSAISAYFYISFLFSEFNNGKIKDKSIYLCSIHIATSMDWFTFYFLTIQLLSNIETLPK